MTDAFEKWIMGMNEEMYTDWLDDKATEAQEEKALEIREPLDEQELAEMEREQEYIPESRQKEVVTDVYDNRDLPPKRTYAEVILPPTGKAPIIKPTTNTIQPPTTIEGAIQTPIERQRFTEYPKIPQPQPRKSISQRISTGIRSFASRINIFRRNKK